MRRFPVVAQSTRCNTTRGSFPSALATLAASGTRSMGHLRLAASSSLARPPSSLCMTEALSTSRRFRSFHFYLNLADPEESRRHVEEDLERLAQENKTDTSAYLHSLLNLSLAYYQTEDFIKARQMAELTHQHALAYNKKSSFLFLTAKTCSKTCTGLADQYEQHVAQVEQAAAKSPASLAPKPSVVFSAQRAIRKLREDATRYEGIANRIYNKPENAFMRGIGAGPSSRARDRKGEGDDDGAASRDGQGSQTAGETRTRPTPRDRRRAFSEDGQDVDLDWERMHGTRWQQQRRRPEHAELRRRQQQVANRGQWSVPK